MTVLASHHRPGDEEARLNRAHHLAACEDLAALQARLRQGGGPRAQARHREQGKLAVRDRVASLLDPGSPFLEVGLLAALDVYPDEVPAAGLVTGVGAVRGRPCLVVANDATVKGGTYHPLTVKKHLRAQEIALENHLPCLYLVDSGGAYLPLQEEVFPDRDHFGRIFYNQAQLSAAGIPQLSAVLGSCTAGGAYVPAMSDQVVHARGGTIFLGGPPLVKAATGEDVGAEDLGGARVHTERSGVSDHYAQDDVQALELLRDLVGRLGPLPPPFLERARPEPPGFDPEELLEVWPRDLRRQADMREVLARVLDGSRFSEFKARYGTTLLAGFGHVEGIPCGILANQGVLMGESALKGTHFIELCTRQGIPLVFLQNITGFMVGRQAEAAGIAKEGAKLVHAVATAAVPKVTLLLGGSFGAGNYGMCGRAFGPRFLWTWPSSRISVMGGEQAAQVLVTVKRDQAAREGRTLGSDEAEAIAGPIRARYEREGHPWHASARLWDDGVIDPRATRAVLAASLAATLHAPLRETRMGVLRM